MSNPKLALVGYGKMGNMLDRLAPEFGFEVCARRDLDRLEPIEGADVAIEFSTPGAVVGNVEFVTGLNIPIIVGTTGWGEHLAEVQTIVRKNAASLVWSPNFSIGVNVFRRLIEDAAKLLANEPAYGAWAWEIHHDTKQDAPSGTLIQLVDAMQSAGYARPIDISSNRAGAHPGTHEIGFDSAADTITLRHTARSREGFARGALKAAQWIMRQHRLGKRGFFPFTDVLFGDQ